jgi:alanine-glyoxylate transaminase / (R)-3-amino-2-methylpropionate-pyruvate transaminase
MANCYKTEYSDIETSFSYDVVIQKGITYTSPSVKSFQAYEKPLVLKKGDGAYLWDVNGKKYLDLMAQNLCISVGYNHPLVNSEVKKQMDILTHSTAMYVQPIPVHYAEELAARFPRDEEWVVHLVNSGAEAVDVAVMMARLYTGNMDIIALENCYHGVQGTAMAVTGIQAFRQPVPLDPCVRHVTAPHPYRGVFGDDVNAYINDIQRTIASSTPGNVAGFIVEPIQGFGGVATQPDGYLKSAFELIRDAGGVCIVDEIQTGVTRTGEHYWGFQREDVVPDIITLGKGIGNGFPLSAVVAKRKVAEAMAGKKWFNTYGSNPMTCAAGRAVLRAIDEDKTQQNASETGALLKTELHRLQEKYDLIGDVRGMGLMLGVELVTDRTMKIPAEKEAARIVEVAGKNGVIIGKGGALGNMLRINPPLCIQKEDIHMVSDVLDHALKGV